MLAKKSLAGLCFLSCVGSLTASAVNNNNATEVIIRKHIEDIESIDKTTKVIVWEGLMPLLMDICDGKIEATEDKIYEELLRRFPLGEQYSVNLPFNEDAVFDEVPFDVFKKLFDESKLSFQFYKEKFRPALQRYLLESAKLNFKNNKISQPEETFSDLIKYGFCAEKGEEQFYKSLEIPDTGEVDDFKKEKII